INLSKSGIGASVGVKGARIGTGPRGTRVTGSLPGTGLYYSKNIGKTSTTKQVTSENKSGLKFLFLILLSLGIPINLFSNLAFNIYLVICLGIIYCLFQTCLFSKESMKNIDIAEVLIEIFSSLLILGIGCYIASSIAFYIFMGMFLLNVIITIGIYKTNKCELEEK
ncbi:MAG: DUF4236 domain-containing protein, partial [Cetobacterium sp.]|uniref:DUF4236 domain-containing protein n=1 Tax=Cetobacterium sp. TaxID=2071632 RepID=UPI003F3AFC7F